MEPLSSSKQYGANVPQPDVDVQRASSSQEASQDAALAFFTNKDGRARSRFPGPDSNNGGGSGSTGQPVDPNTRRVIAFQAAVGQRLLQRLESPGWCALRQGISKCRWITRFVCLSEGCFEGRMDAVCAQSPVPTCLHYIQQLKQKSMGLRVKTWQKGDHLTGLLNLLMRRSAWGWPCCAQILRGYSVR